MRVELRTSPAAAPERYEVPGGACTVWVRQVELAPRPRHAGRARPFAHRKCRPHAPSRRVEGHRFIDLVARRTEAVPVAVPLDAQVHSVLVSSLSGPVLTNSGIKSLRTANTLYHYYFFWPRSKRSGAAKKSVAPGSKEPGGKRRDREVFPFEVDGFGNGLPHPNHTLGAGDLFF